MKKGFIVLYRRLKEKGYYTKSQYVHLWIHLLLSANHEPKEFMWNNEIIIIKEGQLLTGRKQLSRETGIPPTTIERILQMFKSGHQIGQQKTTKFRIITILNWNKYQKRTPKRTTSGQQTDTNNNDNNVTNIYIGIMDFWNSYPVATKTGYRNTHAAKRLLPKCRQMTPDIERAIKTLLDKGYTEEDFINAIKRYMVDIFNRNPDDSPRFYSKHRFSFYEFVKQSNGFIKFANK